MDVGVRKCDNIQNCIHEEIKNSLNLNDRMIGVRITAGAGNFSVLSSVQGQLYLYLFKFRECLLPFSSEYLSLRSAV